MNSEHEPLYSTDRINIAQLSYNNKLNNNKCTSYYLKCFFKKNHNTKDPLGLWGEGAPRPASIITYSHLIGRGRRAPKAYWPSLAVSLCGGVSSAPGSSQSPQPGQVSPAPGLTHAHPPVKTEKRQPAAGRGAAAAAAGEMDEPSDQMRPLLRSVSPRPARYSPPLRRHVSTALCPSFAPSSRWSARGCRGARAPGLAPSGGYYC